MAALNRPLRPACPHIGQVTSLSYCRKGSTVLTGLLRCSAPLSAWWKGSSTCKPKASIRSGKREGVDQTGRRPCGCPLQNYFASSHSWIWASWEIISLIPPVITQLLSSTYHLPRNPLDNTRKNMLSHLTNTEKELSQFNFLRFNGF